MPFVGVWYAELLDYAGVETEYKPAQYVVLVVYWTEYFAVRAVGALAERVSVGCKVLVWRSSDQAADLAVGLRLGPVVVRWELVRDDTGLWLP